MVIGPWLTWRVFPIYAFFSGGLARIRTPELVPCEQTLLVMTGTPLSSYCIIDRRRDRFLLFVHLEPFSVVLAVVLLVEPAPVCRRCVVVLLAKCCAIMSAQNAVPAVQYAWGLFTLKCMNMGRPLLVFSRVVRRGSPTC